MQPIKTTYGFWVIDSDQFISRWAIQAGRLDHDQNLLPQILKHIPKGGIVVDLGAYIGDHTVAYSRAVGVDGLVLAVEPNPIAFECLELNCEALGLSNVIWHKKAAGISINNQAKIDWAVNVDNPGANRIESGSASQEVFVLKENNPYTIDLIKMDIEGWEPAFIRQSFDYLKRVQPTLVIEVNHGHLARAGSSFKELLELLNDLGYSVRNIYEWQPMEGDQFDILAYMP
jgi:FkbM family methyltransferase